jgi:hypothetical protein
VTESTTSGKQGGRVPEQPNSGCLSSILVQRPDFVSDCSSREGVHKVSIFQLA